MPSSHRLTAGASFGFHNLRRLGRKNEDPDRTRVTRDKDPFKFNISNILKSLFLRHLGSSCGSLLLRAIAKWKNLRLSISCMKLATLFAMKVQFECFKTPSQFEDIKLRREEKGSLWGACLALYTRAVHYPLTYPLS
jgi:hypothetical protein